MSGINADRIIDGRDLEPPEPFIRTMEVLDVMGPDEKALLLLGREPFPLYRTLTLNGFEWRTTQASDGGFEILMWHKSSSTDA